MWMRVGEKKVLGEIRERRRAVRGVAALRTQCVNLGFMFR